MIGYSVHHHGSGHFNRALTVALNFAIRWSHWHRWASRDRIRSRPSLRFRVTMPVHDPRNLRRPVHCIGCRVTTTVWWRGWRSSPDGSS